MNRIYRNILLSALLLLACATTLPAQKAGQAERGGINLSLWKGISTQRNDTVGKTWFNLGFLSSANRLQGAGINVLGSIVGCDAGIVQVSGIFNMVGESAKGVQLAGITNVVGEDVCGLSLSGLVNIVGKDTRGVTFAGLANVVGEHGQGIMLGGLANIAGESISGLQLSGLGNVCGDNLRGVALSGLGNVVAGDVVGLQAGTLGNVVGGRMTGAQIGIANLAVRARGLQLGIVNYYKEDFEGLQLGLVNLNPGTRVQGMVFGGIGAGVSTAVRFLNKSTYTILGIGSNALGFGEHYGMALLYRAGMYTHILPRLTLSIDAGFGHVETFADQGDNCPQRLYQLQGRGSVEYRVADNFGVFISGGYGTNKHYGNPTVQCYGPIFEVGTVFFRY